MNTAPDVTIVTVCFNAREQLPACIQSVYEQKLDGLSIEHLVVDGASTDGTPGYLEEQLQAGRIERYVSEPDHGIYDAMNKALRLSCGTVIAFLNADDRFLPRAIRKLASPILEGGADYAFGGARKESGGQFLESWPPNVKKAYIACPYCHQTLFCRTDIMREIGGFDDQAFRIAADCDFMCHLLDRKLRYRCFEEDLVAFSVDGASSNSPKAAADDMVLLLWKHWDVLFQRARTERDFAEFLTVDLLNKVRLLETCGHIRNKDIRPFASHLDRMWSDLEQAGGWPNLSLFSRVRRHFIQPLLQRGRLGSVARARMLWYSYSNQLPAIHPYKDDVLRTYTLSGYMRLVVGKLKAKLH